MAAATRPDVLLLDLYMPELDGHGVLAANCAAARTRPPSWCSPRLLTTSTSSAPCSAGAISYLLKTATAEQVIAAVRDAAAGTASLSPDLAHPAHPGHCTGHRRPTRSAHSRRAKREVLQLIARGHSNRQIARELGIGEQTVKTHVSSVLTKLDLEDRVQAAIFALRHQSSTHEGQP